MDAKDKVFKSEEAQSELKGIVNLTLERESNHKEYDRESRLSKDRERLWAKPTRFVLFLDIMGFKSIVSDNEHDSVQSLLKTFHASRHARDKSFAEDHMRISIFSDSIIIATIDDTPRSLDRLCNEASALMRIGAENGLPMAGGIALGECTFEPGTDIYFGKALTNAYLIEENVFFYGVVLEESEAMASKVNELLSNPIYSAIISHAEVPLKKDGPVERYHLPWNYIFDDNRNLQKHPQVDAWIDGIETKAKARGHYYVRNTRQYICNQTI